MKIYYILDKADMFVETDKFQDIKFWFILIIFGSLIVVAVIDLIVVAVSALIIKESAKRCARGNHNWRGRGGFGCYCRDCKITLKDFVKNGGKV